MKSIRKANPYNQSEEQLLADTIADFYADPLGYVLYAFPWGEEGTELEEEKGPDIWQAQQMLRVQRSIEDDPEGYQIQEAIASGHGVGKILSNSITCDTPDGKRLWGDLQVGDRLFGSNGRPVTITKKFPREDWSFYKVTFSDGSFTYAGKEHKWTVSTKDDRYKKRPLKTVDTETMMNNINRRYQIPLTKPVEYRKKKVPIDPYLVGYILGNGSLCTPSAVKVSCHDTELYDVMETMLPDGLTFSGKARNYRHISAGVNTGRENKLVKLFKDLGLFGVHGLDKFIPDCYKYNSAEVRIELLRGLMDSDGTVSPRKGDNNRKGYKVNYSTSSPHLRDDVVWIIKSLGGVSNYSTDSRNKDNYEVHVNLPNNINPFKLERKKILYDDYVNTVKKEPLRAVTSIEYSHNEAGHCVTVDAPDHLYLANDFIVTHNSCEVAWLILWALSTRPHIAAVITANTDNQLRTKTWKEVAKWHKMARNSHWFEWTATRLSHVEHPETWYAVAIPNSEHNSESFAGTHATHVLVVFDEASAIPNVIWEVTEGAMTTPRAMWFCYGNPTRNSGRFRECFGKFKHRWSRSQIDSRTCRKTDKPKINQWAEDWGEDSDFFRVRVKGEFPRSGTTQLISSEVINEARTRQLQIVDYMYFPVVVSVDVARFGEDETVVCVRQGRKLHGQYVFRQLRNTQVAAKSAHIWREFKKQGGTMGPIMVDGIGTGSGVVDYLYESGYPVVDVNVGGTADNEVLYYNKRAECYMRAKEWFDSGADIPDDPELGDQLGNIEYMFDNKERVRIERKEDMKARGLGSPDRADALILGFAEHVQPADMQGVSGGALSFEPDWEE